MSSEKLGIYGGSFSPPHAGHLHAALSFVQAAELDRLIIMPAASAPNKNGYSSADAMHRYEMAKIAFAVLGEQCEVSDFELQKGGISYTVDTLEHFASMGYKLSFLCGTDMLLSFKSWRRYQDILAITDLVCVRRENDSFTARRISEVSGELVNECNAKITVVSQSPEQIKEIKSANGGYLKSVGGKIYEMSSSELRPAYATDETEKGMLESIDEYIRFFCLYRPNKAVITEEMLKELRRRVSERVSAKRFEHILGVEQTAAWLGGIFLPDDIMRLRAAALLHDVTKELPVEKELQILMDCDTISDGCMKEAEGLYGTEPVWHAATAAKRLPYDFPEFCDEGICNMVRWHTTGRCGMSADELIICLSDFIEPTRKYGNCIELRHMLKDELESAENAEQRLKALLRVTSEMLERTVKILKEQGKQVAKESLEALDYVKLEYSKIYNKKLN